MVPTSRGSRAVALRADLEEFLLASVNQASIHPPDRLCESMGRRLPSRFHPQVNTLSAQRCRDRPHWEVSDNWTACFITHATATTPNTRPPVTAPIIPTTTKKMLNGSGSRSDTETAKSPMTIAPTPQSAINGLLNFSAMRSQPPRTRHSEKPSRPRRLATKLHRLCPDASKNPRRFPVRTPSEEVVSSRGGTRTHRSGERTCQRDRRSGPGPAFDERAILELLDRLFDLLAFVHDDRTPPSDRLVQGSAGHQKEPRCRVAGLDADGVTFIEDDEVAVFD